MAEAIRKKTVKFENNYQNVEDPMQQMQGIEVNDNSEMQIEEDYNNGYYNGNGSEKYSERTGQESLAFDSQKIKQQNPMGPQQIILDDNFGSRTQQEMENDIKNKAKALYANTNAVQIDEINIQLNEKNQKSMNEVVQNLFQMLKISNDKKVETVDVAHLKAYMQFQALGTHNPTLFKKINDKCIETKNRGELTEKEFFGLFLNESIFLRDLNRQQDQKFQPPSIEEIAQIFEFLDDERTGMIKAKDLMTFLENAERLKISNIDLKKFKESQMNDPPSLRNKLDIMQKEVDELIKTFDLTGDQLISPEEFFNIIMYAYS